MAGAVEASAWGKQEAELRACVIRALQSRVKFLAWLGLPHASLNIGGSGGEEGFSDHGCVDGWTAYCMNGSLAQKRKSQECQKRVCQKTKSTGG